SAGIHMPRIETIPCIAKYIDGSYSPAPPVPYVTPPPKMRKKLSRVAIKLNATSTIISETPEWFDRARSAFFPVPF
ncbi:MAG: hypothetical protein ACLVLT_20450, partial [Emergencia timonensis]